MSMRPWTLPTYNLESVPEDCLSDEEAPLRMYDEGLMKFPNPADCTGTPAAVMLFPGS